jgi:hypothetical protein
LTVLLLGKTSEAQLPGQLVLIKSDTLLCFTKQETSEIADSLTIGRQNAFRVQKCLKREILLERMLQNEELKVSVQDSLIQVLERQIIFADEEVDRINQNCKKEKRGQLLIGVLAGAGLVAVLGAIFGP